MSSSTTAHKFSSLEARAPEAEADLRRELLTLLDGSEVDEAWVSDALGGSFVLDRSSLEQQHAVHGNMGILDTGQSLSADLQVAPAGTAAVEPAGGGTPQPQGLYIKKIQAKRFAHKKTPQNLRRDLASCHNECSFYKNIAPLLPQEGASSVRIPRCYYAGERSFHEAESEEQLAQSEYMLVLETMTQQQQPPTGSASTGGTARPPALCQHSPLSRSEAMQSLDLLARFHAWAWNDAERLAVVRSMLLPRASYWDLPRRGEAEMHLMPEIWVTENGPPFSLSTVKNNGLPRQARDKRNRKLTSFCFKMTVVFAGCVFAELCRAGQGGRRGSRGAPVTAIGCCVSRSDGEAWPLDCRADPR
jgi:hypothetical protein